MLLHRLSIYQEADRPRICSAMLRISALLSLMLLMHAGPLVLLAEEEESASTETSIPPPPCEEERTIDVDEAGLSIAFGDRDTSILC